MSLRRTVLQRLATPLRSPSPSIPTTDLTEELPAVSPHEHLAKSSQAELMSSNGMVKRWRVNIAESSLPAELSAVSLSGTVHKDKEFWFDDGNIVLLVRETGFKVYRGMLTKHSVIFRDMSSMAQPTNVETMDSCPVVHLADAPDDIRHLLRAIFGPPRFPIMPGDRIEFSELAALIRMTHKYHMEELYERAMHHLKLYFTSDLSIWDTAGIDGNVYLHIQPTDAITAVNLARLTNTPTVLPTALYLCCQLDKELSSGVERGDGTTERLDARDFELCLRGRTELVRASTRGACTICKPEVSPQCGAKGCERSLREILNMMLEGLQKDPIGDIAGYAALDSWEHWIEDVVEVWPLCEACRAILHARDMEVRREVWRALPTYMGVAVEEWKDPTAGHR